MSDARKRAEEALAEIAAGDHGEYCGLRNGMLLAGGKTECYSDCPKRIAKEALEALLAAEPAPAPDAVREAAEEWAAAEAEYDATPAHSRDTDAFERNLFRRQAARRRLLAALDARRRG